MFYSLIILCFIPVIGCADIWYRSCGGSDIRVDSIDIKPYPIKYPGNVEFSPSFEVLQDIPNDDDIKISMSLVKLTPKRMHIPCLNGFGSCTVDYCKDYDSNFLLAGFGFGKCPMNKGKYSIHHPSTPMPNFGSIFDKIIEGDYEGNSTFYHGKTNQVYSCTQFRLTIELSK